MFAITVILALPVAFHVLLRLATDIPLFIWKGDASRPATELAPIHQYACAPLAFAPLVFAAIACLFYLLIVSLAPNPDEDLFSGLSLAVVVIIPAWLLFIALIFMHVSSKPRSGKLLLFAAYMPFHWLCMLAVSFLGFCVVVKLATLAFHIH